MHPGPADLFAGPVRSGDARCLTPRVPGSTILSLSGAILSIMLTMRSTMLSRSVSLLLALGVLAGCSKSTTQSRTTSPAPAPKPAAAAKTPAPGGTDPRQGLKAGETGAGEAVWNARSVALAAKAPGFETSWNSD